MVSPHPSGVKSARLLVALWACGASAQELAVTVDPPLMQLGVTQRAIVTVVGPADLTDLHLSANHGVIGPARRVSPGVYEAEYLPPSQLFPRVAALSAWALRGEQVLQGFTPLPLWGSGIAKLTARPQTPVTLFVGSRAFGPVETNRAGQAAVQVQVPPGTSRVRHGNKSIDLNLPVVSRLHLVAMPEQISADAPTEVRLRVYCLSAAGDLEQGPVELFVSKGTLGPLTWLRPGVAEAAWQVPALEPQQLEASATLNDRAAPSTASLRVASGAVAELEFDDPGAFVAGQEPLELRLRVRDARGRPAEGAVLLTTDLGVVGPTTPGEPGELRARLALPDRFEGRAEVTVTAGAGAVSTRTTVHLVPGPPRELALEGAAVARAEETLVIAGSARDRFGNPAAILPAATVARGSVMVSASGAGFEVRFTAPPTRTPEQVALYLTVAELKERRVIEVQPRPGWMTAAARGGFATNFGLIAAPAGALELGLWTEVGRRRVGVLLEGGAIAASYRAAVEQGPALVAQTTFVPGVVSLAAQFAPHGRVWLRPGLGAGLSGLFQRTLLGERWLTQSGAGPCVQLSLQAGLRVLWGGPVLEVRALWVGNPGLATLQGSLFSLLTLVGYSFDVL